MACSRSASMAANSSSVMSPISRCISASSRRPRKAESSFSSASAAVTTVCRVQRMPAIINESSRNTSAMSVLSGPFELEPDVDEVVRGPRPRVLERELVEMGGDLLDAAIERLLLIALYEERGVHDHLVADGPVHPRCHRYVAQPLEKLGDVPLRARLERRVDEAAVLHPREIGRALLRRDFGFQPVNILVFS